MIGTYRGYKFVQNNHARELRAYLSLLNKGHIKLKKVYYNFMRTVVIFS